MTDPKRQVGASQARGLEDPLRLDADLKAAIGDLKLQWENKPPTRCERIVVKRLEFLGSDLERGAHGEGPVEGQH